MLNASALDLLFHNARSHNDWQEKPVEDALLTQLYDLTKMAPTSANCQPLRLVFVKSQQAKETLKPCLDEGNIEKTMRAPVCAILAMDMDFAGELATLFPHAPDAKNWFKDNAEETAFRNSSLQGGYFILAARALGLDCGPMSGFDANAVDAAFFAGTNYRSNFLCNLGYGKQEALMPRLPRPAFTDYCKIM